VKAERIGRVNTKRRLHKMLLKEPVPGENLTDDQKQEDDHCYQTRVKLVTFCEDGILFQFTIS
jgi:hypothetical protein